MFVINECTLAGCALQLGPSAVKLIQLYNAVLGTEDAQGFVPEVAADGSITIK